MERFFVFMGIYIFVFGFIGCGNEEPVIVSQAGARISEGWKEYIAGNFEHAIAKFQEALNEEPINAEAYNGIGWAKAKLGQFDGSIDSFKSAITQDPNKADAHAGLAGAYLASGDYERAIASAKLALSLDPKYASSHDNINADDIYVLLAVSYYGIGDYTNAKAQVDILGGSGKLPDTSDPAYLADLLLVIEELAKKSLLID